MTAEEALKNTPPILRIITGSRLYGTDRRDEDGNEISDIDLRDVIIPPFEFLTLIRNDSCSQGNGIETEDHLVYSLNFFTSQLLSSNPQFLELLFAPKENILIQTEIGKELMELRDKVISNRLYRRLTGFAQSEYRKACGEKLIFEEAKPSEEQAWDIFRETFGPKWGDRRKELADEIKALAYSAHTFTLVPSVDGISKKRRGEFAQFGYCASSACHSLRILRQAAELMRTGKITFPRPDAFELREIKMGRSNLDVFKALYEVARADAEVALKESILPEWPDKTTVTAWLDKQVVSGISNDPRFRELSHLGLDIFGPK